MTDQALQAKRGGFVLLRPLAWAGNLFSTDNVDPIYAIDQSVLRSAVDDHIMPALDQPVEPSLSIQGGEFTVEAGAIGTTVDPDELAQLLPTVVEVDDKPLRLDLAPLEALPRLTDEQVEQVAAETNALTTDPLVVQVLDDEAALSTSVQSTPIA